MLEYYLNTNMVEKNEPLTKTYVYRMYPTEEQKVLLNKTFGCVRVVWNRNVFTYNSYDKETNPKPVYQSSTEMREELEWMQEVSAGALQQKEIDFKNYLKQNFSKNRKTKLGRPSYKKRGGHQSFRLPNQKFSLHENMLKLEKMEPIEVIIDRKIPEGVKFMRVTVKKDPVGRFFAKICVEQVIEPRFPMTGTVVGVDVGLKHFLTLSTGESVENPRWFRESQAELRKAQKSLSRKVKGSSRYEKAKLRVARIHSRIANERKWFHDQIALDLVRNHDLIVIEDLNIAGMKKNHKLAKSISDAGWGQFFKILDYKALWNDKVVIKVGRFFPSSRLCTCGVVNKDLKLSDRVWTCSACGAVHDRDPHAARNMGVEGLRIFKERCAQMDAPHGGVHTTQHMELHMLNGCRVDVRQPARGAIGGEASKKSENKGF